MRPDFARRSNQTELMDADCDYETFRGCLVDLARVNRLTLGYRPTLAFLDRLRKAGRLPQGRALHVLDVGSGHGDMLRAVARWAQRHGIAVTLTGVDLSPWAAIAAREATPANVVIHWHTDDIFDFQPDRPVDVVLSALVAHHMTDDMVVRFLRWQEDTARIGWFVNDLHRHPLPYRIFGPASRLLRMHHFVQHDGPVSIARGFVPQDWKAYLAAAQVDGAKVQWWMPFRLCVARSRPA